MVDRRCVAARPQPDRSINDIDPAIASLSLPPFRSYAMSVPWRRRTGDFCRTLRPSGIAFGASAFADRAITSFKTTQQE
jgi:hypothetical protein